MKQQLGKYREIRFILNSETGYYEKQPLEMPFQKVPFELKLESSQANYLRIIGATKLLRSRTVKGKKKFHTGLVPLAIENAYEGNQMEMVKGAKVLSLVICYFKDHSELVMYHFNRYYIDAPKVRLERCNQFIEQIIKGA